MNPEAKLFAQFNDAVEDRFPIAIAREVVVGDEVGGDAGAVIGTDNRFHVVGRAVARFASLHFDDGAEATVEGASAPRIEGADIAQILPNHTLRQVDGRLSFK